mgnify:CR=1 FL=1
MQEDSINVLGGPLEECSTQPLTGFFAMAVVTPGRRTGGGTRFAP